MTEQDTPTTRRAFLGGTLAAAGATLAGCGPKGQGSGAANVISNKKVRWRLASSFPKSLDTIYGAGERFAQLVEDLTGGNFKIKVYAAGELVPGLKVLDAVQEGSAEVGHTAGYYYVGKNETMAFDAAVPFGLSARQHMAWLENGGLELMREVVSDFNVISFPGGNTGVQMGGWFRRDVHTLADLKGLKMRIPGLGGKVMSELGVTVQVIAGGEIFQALERGTIDATEWVGPYDDMKLGFHKVTKNYYYPGWWEPGPALSFYVNKDAWNKLPASYQQAVDTAARQAGIGMLIDYDAKNPAALKQLLDGGVTLKPFSDEILEGARTASQALLAGFVAKNKSFEKVFTHWDAFRKDSSKWFSTAALSYMKFAYKGL